MVCLAIFSFYGTAYATLNIDTTVDVPVSCSVTDTDGLVHNYATGSYLSICALDAATKNGSVSSPQLSNQYPSLGLFITAINNVVADPNSQYWALYQNGSFASLGLSSLPVQAGDTIMLQLHDFSDNNLGDQVILHIHSLVIPPPAVGSAPLTTSDNSITPTTITPIPVVKPVFDVKKAFDFLIAQQKDDGSFGEDLYTDWTALALASGNYQDQTLKLVKYLGGSGITGELLTDYERRAMALMALGLNPYGTNGINYIEKITAGFDGKQFGNPQEDNDDIFALIVLANAAYSASDQIIKDDILFVLSAQNQNGSWDNSADMTGAAMEALSAFSPIPGIGESLEKAKNFLKQNQKDNGGWNDNASSTAWASEGILAFGEKLEDWVKSENTPLHYLASLQDIDGGIKENDLNSKIWESAYAVSALSGKNWNQIMQKFEKPAAPAVIVETPAPQMTRNSAKMVGVKPKIEKTAMKNTANILSAVQNTETAAPQPPAKKNWFRRILDSIFGF